MRFHRTVCILMLGALFFGVWTAPLAAQEPIVIGVVLDGPWERNDEIRGAFETEISSLLGAEFGIQFPLAKRIEADWTNEGVRSAVDNLLADPEVDIILALGPQSSNDVAQRPGLSKPVLAAFVIDVDLQGVPLQLDPAVGRPTSGVPNLSYVVVGTDTEREIRFFHEIVPFERLTFLTSRGLRDGIPELGGRLGEVLAELGAEVDVVVVDDSAQAALEFIPTDTDAVYITPLLQLSSGEFDRLISGLIERRLPSFSMWGRSEVERGILAALGLDLDYERVARRVAVNVQRILVGDDAASFPVDFERRERLTINMATARAIEFYPSWSIITEAELLNGQDPPSQREWSLATAARQAEVSNRDLAAAQRDVSAGLQRIRRARSGFLPQLFASATGTVIDEDRAQASLGSTGRQTYSTSLRVDQLVYSDKVNAVSEIEGHLQRTRESARDAVRLDVIQDAATTYLTVLAAKTSETIHRNNLELTRTNLELARARQQLGVGRATEVLRWENQIATNRREVINSNARRNQAEIALNRILNRPLEESFETQEATLTDPEITSSFSRLEPYIGNFGVFDIFRDFMVEEAFTRSPEILSLDAAIDAQRRTLVAAERSFYLPELRTQAQITALTQVDADSAGVPSIPIPIFPSPGNVNWNIGFAATLPLYTGSGRRADRDRASEELAALLLEREAVRERIEQRTRSDLHIAMASFAGIELSNAAATAAFQNLDLVSDAYSNGVVDILDLLDAQNAALLSELAAANAVYTFLIDLMDVQRSIGRFDFFVSPDEDAAFFQRLNRYFVEAGYPID